MRFLIFGMCVSFSFASYLYLGYPHALIFGIPLSLIGGFAIGGSK